MGMHVTRAQLERFALALGLGQLKGRKSAELLALCAEAAERRIAAGGLALDRTQRPPAAEEGEDGDRGC
jgi:hypothetical protein